MCTFIVIARPFFNIKVYAENVWCEKMLILNKFGFYILNLLNTHNVNYDFTSIVFKKAQLV